MAQEVDIYDDFSEDSFEEEKIETPVAEPAPAKIGGKPSHTEPLIVVRKEEEKTISEDEESISTESDNESVSSNSSSSDGSTIECLSRDPLFLVLSQFLSNDKGNIVDALCDMNRNLKKIAHALKKRS